MNGCDRLEAFEKMLADVQHRYSAAEEKMKQLKSQGREKTATFRQLMGDKLQYQNMLTMYRLYGLLDGGGQGTQENS